MDQPTSREVTIHILPESYTLIDEMSEGEGAEKAITKLVEAEAQRLFHVKRCRPKPRGPAKPLGRPRIPAEQKRGVEAYEILDGIFSKLLKIKGEEVYDRRYKPMMQQIVQMQQDGDWQGLERFLAERGWEKQQ